MASGKVDLSLYKEGEVKTRTVYNAFAYTPSCDCAGHDCYCHYPPPRPSCSRGRTCGDSTCLDYHGPVDETVLGRKRSIAQEK